MKKKVITEVIASLLIILFIYTGLMKLIDYNVFKLQLRKSPFITSYAGILSWSLPVIELTVASLLVYSKTRLKGFYASLFLMIMFTAYVYAMLHYSDYLPCSCGGVISSMSWQQHLVFNSIFVLLSIAGIVLLSDDIQKAKNIMVKPI